jgi:hypothetical protein
LPKGIREFWYKGTLIAVLVTNEFESVGPHALFFSDPKSSLQVGAGTYPKGHVGEPHDHERSRVLEAHYEELLHLDRGRMEVSLYGNDRKKFATFMMKTGETIHLISGGHAFRMLTACRCIEVKQGPYAGQNKKYFSQPGSRSS